MRRLALLVVVVPALLSACDVFLPPTGCTLIGCSSSISFLLPAAQTQTYTVTVESDALSGSFECVPPSAQDPNGVWTARAFNGDLREQPPALATAVCDDDRVSLQLFDEDPALPDELTVEIAGETPLSETFSDIEYVVSQPNGPDCPPTCSQVELSLDDA